MPNWYGIGLDGYFVFVFSLWLLHLASARNFAITNKIDMTSQDDRYNWKSLIWKTLRSLQNFISLFRAIS